MHLCTSEAKRCKKRQHSPINVEGALIPEAWERELPPLDPHRDFILNGVRQGFRITNKTVQGDRVYMENYKSCTNRETFDIVERQIREEIDNNRYVVCEAPKRITSALGAIPKPEKGRVRLIHDCSRPAGSGVNDFAENVKFSYQSLQDGLDLVVPGAWMAKLDLASAYRSVKVSPLDYCVTGLSWKFKGMAEVTYMYDQRLPFGARLSPGIFNTLSQAIRRMMARKGFKNVVAYCDDFLCVSSSKEECIRTLNTLWSLCRKLGFAINYNKVIGPVTKITFLGITIDSKTMTLGLPAEKVTDLCRDIQSLIASKSASKRTLQSVAGKLNWASRVIQGGRFFVSEVYGRIKTLRGMWHRTRITQQLRRDLLWWSDQVSNFNGTLPIVDSREQTPLCIDACTEGGGGYYGGEWFYLSWNHWPGMADKHINFKEVLTLEPAAHIFAPWWANKRITVYSDSTAAVGMINKGRAPDSEVNDSLRRVYWLSAKFNFQLKALHYPGRYNEVADRCSRLAEPGGFDKLVDVLNHTLVDNGEGSGPRSIQAERMGSKHP